MRRENIARTGSPGEKEVEVVMVMVKEVDSQYMLLRSKEGNHVINDTAVK